MCQATCIITLAFFICLQRLFGFLPDVEPYEGTEISQGLALVLFSSLLEVNVFKGTRCLGSSVLVYENKPFVTGCYKLHKYRKMF